MIIHAPARKAQQDEPDTSGDRDAARLLALLEDNPDEPLTIAAMRDRGVRAPGQVIYALQLAGYDIDRAPAPGNPCGPLGYRLRSGIPRLDGRADASKARAADEP